MSLDRQRLVGAIRRIANVAPEDGDRNAAASNRGSQPGSVGRGITENSDRLCCDGSVSGNANPGTNTRDPDTEGQDGLDSSDPADTSPDLSGVTNCDTGEPICFDSTGFIPPDGWGSPNEPPTAEGYTEGYYWLAVIGGSVKYSNHPGGFSGDISALYPIGTSPIRYYVSDYATKVNDERYDVTVVQAVYSEEGGEFLGFSEALAAQPERQVCDGNPVCDDPPPTESHWPTDGCINLAIIDGRIVGSKFDPENDGSYSAPRDEIELCDGSNGSILIRGSAGGGWKSIASLEGDIDPDTDHGYLYSAYGDVIRQISPSEFRDDRV